MFAGAGGFYPSIIDPGYLVRSITTHTTGQWYFEITINAAAKLSDVGVGVDNGTENLNLSGGQAKGICWVGSGSVNYNGTLNAYLASTFFVGDILGVAVDITNAKIWFRENGGNWNNSASANPATNTGGFSISAIVPTVYALAQLSSVGDQVTANFLGTFGFSAPAGFSAWG